MIDPIYYFYIKALCATIVIAIIAALSFIQMMKVTEHKNQSFDSKCNAILHNIRKASNHKALDDLERYTIRLILKDHSEVVQNNVLVISESFRLRRFQIEGNPIDEMEAAQNIEKLLLKTPNLDGTAIL